MFLNNSNTRKKQFTGLQLSNTFIGREAFDNLFLLSYSGHPIHPVNVDDLRVSAIDILVSVDVLLFT